MLFHNRTEAGKKLGKQLVNLRLQSPIVLAIPRGGVPVGAAVAETLGCPFDVISLIKIPIPWSSEASYGVVVMDGTIALNKPLVNRLELSDRELEMAESLILQEVKHRERMYRQGRPFPDLGGKSVIITDDGLASGTSMLAALSFVKKRLPLSLVVASPVASDMAHKSIAAQAGIDKLVILATNSEPLFSLSSYYREFPTLTDDDVLRELNH